MTDRFFELAERGGVGLLFLMVAMAIAVIVAFPFALIGWIASRFDD